MCNLLGFPVPIINNDIFNSNNFISDDYENIIDDLNIDFINMLFEQCKKNLVDIKTEKNDFIVSIHIRRGDVQKNNKW